MSANDKIVLDNEFDAWRQKRAASLGKVDAFFYFSADLVLRKFAPADEDILAGWTDGEDDGGADGIYLVGNKNTFITGDTDPAVLKDVGNATLIVIQVKGGGAGFEEGEVRKMRDLLGDLLDSSKDESAYKVKYNSRVLAAIRTFHSAYKAIGTTSFSVAVEYCYVVRRDGMVANNKVLAFVDECRSVVGGTISKSTFVPTFVNAETLVGILKKRPTNERTLEWSEPPIDVDDNFAGLVRLDKFLEFISNSDGELEERLFDSNVRGFQDETHVNKQILESLSGGSGIDFWLLNNGVTVLAEDASRAGKTRLQMKDPQIVNGLQTSRVIHRYFQGREKIDTRLLLVRVIKTTDPAVRDAVIRATNSQNKMSAASLRSTRKIHHDIEHYFKSNGLFYDRRKGHYKDRGESIASIVSMMDVVKAGVAVLLHRPDDARGRPGLYITDDAKYESLFDDEAPVGAYLVSVKVVRRVDAFLDDQHHDTQEPLDASYRLNIRYYVAARLVWDLTQHYAPAMDTVSALDVGAITEKQVRRAYEAVAGKFDKLGASDAIAKGPTLLKAIVSGPKRKYIATEKMRRTPKV